LHTATTPNTVTFANSLRADASLMPYDNTDFFRSNWLTNQKHRIWLDFVNTTTGSKDRTLVGYASNATDGRDSLYDCIFKLTGDLSIYSLLQDEPFTIQGKGLPFTGNDSIPLGVNCNVNGTFDFAIYKTDGLFSGAQPIYLEDKATGNFHDLKASPFSVVLNKGTYNDRFVLHFALPGGSLLNAGYTLTESVIASVNNQVIMVQSALEEITEIQVLDVLGRTICTIQGNNTSLVLSTPPLAINSQTVFVKVKLASGIIVTRKVLL